MKILIFSHFKPYPPNHGASHRIWHIALAYSQLKNDVIIIHNSFKDNKYKKKKTKNITLVQVPFLFKFMQKKHFIFQNNLNFFREFLKNKEADIVQIEFPYLFPLLFFVKLFRKKIIYDSHGVEYLFQKEVYNRSKLTLFIVKILENLSLKLSDVIFCTSQIDKEYFIKNYKIKKEKIKIIPNVVDVASFRNVKPLKFKKKTILFIGSQLHPANKESIEIIHDKIVPYVLKRIKNVQFCFIGKNPPDYLKNNENILVLGEVNDVRPYILGSTLCISPILKGAGTRIKILDYMAGKKCIISATKGAEGISFKNNENIIIKDDIEEFSREIVDLLENIKKREQIGKNAYNLIKKEYSLEIVKDKLNKLNILNKDKK